VTSIGNYTFYGCSSLTAITIPDGVTEIGKCAFSYCDSLTAVTIPDGVTTIGRAAFRDCSSLTKLILSPTVSIGEDCFSDCTTLIAATADKNMPTVSDLLHYRWRRGSGWNVAVIERVNALLCLKGTWDQVEDPPSGQDSLKRKRTDESGPDSLKRKRTEVEDPLMASEARDKIPKELWRVILEYL
jgi:hypothetical protein